MEKFTVVDPSMLLYPLLNLTFAHLHLLFSTLLLRFFYSKFSHPIQDRPRKPPPSSTPLDPPSHVDSWADLTARSKLKCRKGLGVL